MVRLQMIFNAILGIAAAGKKRSAFILRRCSHIQFTPQYAFAPSSAVNGFSQVSRSFLALYLHV